MIFSIFGHFYKTKKVDNHSSGDRFLVLIPAYKEDEIIIHTAEEALGHDFKGGEFDVVVIADKLKQSTVETIRNMGATVIEVFFDRSTKTKSINKALEEIQHDYDHIVILDADNVMEKNCLDILNGYLNKGFYAVQGHRTAKNRDSAFALLDSISEEINNHVFRKGHRALGFSSALIGSGMAFKFHFFKEIMKGNEEMGGEDKEAEFRIIGRRKKIAYADNAIIYDEKVSSAAVFAKQRTRWIAGQFYFFRDHFKPAFLHLLKGNFDYFEKFLQAFIPPRVLMLGVLPIMGLISLLIPSNIPWYSWFALLGIFLFANLISIPSRFYNRDFVSAALQLPKAIIAMMIGIFSVTTAHKTNFHTPKTKKSVEKK
ncbi:glycosyltransferase [Marinigracilibium pacificum]|uniref:Glycosyltransferase family 2 protein n=1 Tax=Marinigracilibium pacificum TaxID=2729599 RepID=A0A848IVB5_9BACT|nr:glycosyltransferase family 2 protein [Marinigracilibium pacificum]NMM47225.1 glycosyltransferase family 2 protein [Marinigracilibium pacificum]